MLGANIYSVVELSDKFHLRLKVYNKMLNDFLTATEGYHRVLDVGCGSGNLSLRFLEQGHEVTCVDKDDARLDGLVRKTEKTKKPRIIRSSFEEVLFPQEDFDAVTSSLVLTYIDDIPLHFSKVHEVLRLGGRFVLSYRIPDVINADLGYEVIMIYSEFFDQGILPEHEEWWRQIVRECSLHKKISKERGLSVDKVQRNLKEAGFGNIHKRYVLPGRDYVMITADKN